MHTKILYFLPVFLAACSQAVPVPTLIVSPTLAIPATATTPLTQQIPLTRIPGWDYDTPISTEQPWLLHSHEEWGLFVTNMDGSGFKQISLPKGYITDDYYFPRRSDFSPDRELLTLIDTLHSSLSMAILGIVSTSTGELIFETSVVGQLAKEKIEIEGYSDLDSALFWSRFLWSPDGNYLAFVGALEGTTTDIYVYDVSLNKVRKLTETPEEVVILDWSPDSENIIFYSVSEFLVTDRFVRDIWSVNVNGLSNVLYHVNDIIFRYFILGWINNNEFIGYLINYDQPEDELVIIDIQTREVELIFEGDPDRIIFNDTKYPRLFINFGSTIDNEYNKRESYEYNFDNNKLELFKSNILIQDFFGESNYFTSYHYLELEGSGFYINIYNFDGNLLITRYIPWYGAGVSFYISQDNQFIYVFAISLSLYSSDGTYIKDLKSNKQGNYYLTDEKIYFSEKVGNEEIVILYEISQENGWGLIEIARFPTTQFSVISP